MPRLIQAWANAYGMNLRATEKRRSAGVASKGSGL